jgi:hypothetical protein
MKCKYKGCNEENFEENDYCILHLDFPLNENDPEFDRFNILKEKEVENKKSRLDYNFKGVILYNANFNGLKIKNDLIFANSHIKNNFNCKKSEIEGDIWFDGVKIEGNCFFEQSNITGTASFFKGEIKGNINFDKSSIGKYAWFEEFKTSGEASFNHAAIGSSLSFKKSFIADNVSFYGAKIGGYAWFDEANIGGNTWFDLTDIKGGLSFKNTIFKNIRGKERAYRSAKIIWERLGDRDRADYHYYHEMEAKRIQKPVYIRYPELIVQYPFGYGVHPSRLLFTFLGVLILFGILYWLIKGNSSMNELFENMRFSFLTLIIPAYGVINAKSGLLGIFIIIEAFIGAFTWPTFIVTFARKYMR